MFFEPADESEITEIVSSLRSGTAGGYNNIPMCTLKDFIDLISKPLTHIINLSIQSGIVPDQMIVARVLSIFKSGEGNFFSNYWPISIIPVYSKVLEKVVYNRLLHYLNKQNILFDNQMASEKIVPLCML